MLGIQGEFVWFIKDIRTDPVVEYQLALVRVQVCFKILIFVLLPGKFPVFMILCIYER